MHDHQKVGHMIKPVYCITYYLPYSNLFRDWFNNLSYRTYNCPHKISFWITKHYISQHKVNHHSQHTATDFPTVADHCFVWWYLNSQKPGDAIWCPGTCCLMAPSHYLNHVALSIVSCCGIHQRAIIQDAHNNHSRIWVWKLQAASENNFWTQFYSPKSNVIIFIVWYGSGYEGGPALLPGFLYH